MGPYWDHNMGPLGPGPLGKGLHGPRPIGTGPIGQRAPGPGPIGTSPWPIGTRPLGQGPLGQGPGPGPLGPGTSPWPIGTRPLGPLGQGPRDRAHWDKAQGPGQGPGPRDQEAAVAADREWGVWGGEAPPPIIYFLFLFLDLNQGGIYSGEGGHKFQNYRCQKSWI